MKMPNLPFGLFGVAAGEPNARNNDQEQMTDLQKLYAATQAANRTPQGRIDRGFSAFGPAGQMPQPTEPMLPTPPTPAPVDMAPPPSPTVPPALSPQALGPAVGPTSVGGAPLPSASPLDTAVWPAGPASGPAQSSPGMGFFQRNAAMMTDPTNGGFIDPEGAARAQASGPDVINKLMSYFHNKDTSNG